MNGQLHAFNITKAQTSGYMTANCQCYCGTPSYIDVIAACTQEMMASGTCGSKRETQLYT